MKINRFESYNHVKDVFSFSEKSEENNNYSKTPLLKQYQKE